MQVRAGIGKATPCARLEATLEAAIALQDTLGQVPDLEAGKNADPDGREPDHVGDAS